VIEHVGLILGEVDGGVQLGAMVAVDDARVVAGREPVEPELQHAREHQVEPDERVAANTRIRRPSLEVVAVKRLDDALAELSLEVPAVVRNAEQARHAPRILNRRQRAAPAVLRSFFSVAARPLLKRDADDIVALRLQQRGRNRRVDPTRHRNRNPHRRFSTMCRPTISASSPTP
jgi:hypothetical protein